MSADATLGGYLEVHERPPAFSGVDGAAYSAAVYVDDEPDPAGRYGAALLFVRWSPAGDQPEGHVETPYLSFGHDPATAARGVLDLTLHDVKGHLDRAITEKQESRDW
jgi:hypothetical protein